MSYWDRWGCHAIAPFTGEGFSDKLARDFWLAGENLWSPEDKISWRWLKLLWVYSASAVAQICVPGCLVLMGLEALSISKVSFGYGLIGGAAIGFFFAVLIATVRWISIRRARNSIFSKG